MNIKYFISTLKKLILISVFTFIFLEVALCAYTYFGNLKIEVPTYTLENTQSFWFDINEGFGTCHLPNHSYRQKKTCYDIIYTSNPEGFRDKDRLIKSINKRVLVLGDSFIEGVGVETDKRMSDLLEKEKDTPHLNFGMAGNFGPTQYYILYKTLASSYTHNAVLIGILPSNDFIDDDYDFNVNIDSNRYKPYLVGTYPKYSLVYYKDSIHKSKVHLQKLKPIKRVLKNFTYTYNVLLYLKRSLIQPITLNQNSLIKDQVPDYFNYSKAQLDRVKYSLSEIKSIAGNRKLMVFTIPTFEEIKTYRKYRKNPLGIEMSVFCKSQNIEYLDLLAKTDEISIEECEEHFLNCDGHWSGKGNIFAKELIESYFNYYQ